MSTSKPNEDELYQEYFSRIYRETSGYLTYPQEQRDHFTKTKVCTTYGEMLYPGVKKMLKNLQLGPDEVFLDLGSGLGKLALQVFMQTNVSKVLGIEASKQLCDQVEGVLERVKKDFPVFWENNRQLKILNDNFLNADWNGTTIVYTCSTSFTDELMSNIIQKINDNPKITQVLSMRSMSNLKLPLKKVIEVECSWDTSHVHYYSN